MPKRKNDEVSIRVRIESELLERMDKLVGPGGRQHFIRDAILWRLDQEIPPIVMEIQDEVEELRSRVEHLEQAQSTNIYLESLNITAKERVCRDSLDRAILGYFLREEGATTPELASNLLGDESKRRTVLDRIDKLNERASEELGAPILTHEKGIVNGKRGAWWLTNRDILVE